MSAWWRRTYRRRRRSASGAASSRNWSESSRSCRVEPRGGCEIEHSKKLEELRAKISQAEKESEAGNSILAHSEVEIANCKEQTKLISGEIVRNSNRMQCRKRSSRR